MIGKTVPGERGHEQCLYQGQQHHQPADNDKGSPPGSKAVTNPSPHRPGISLQISAITPQKMAYQGNKEACDGNPGLGDRVERGKRLEQCNNKAIVQHPYANQACRIRQLRKKTFSPEDDRHREGKDWWQKRLRSQEVCSGTYANRYIA